MKKQPNILLFFVDQQRFDTIHALGNPVIRTPNLDRLCREGTAFTSAYSPSPVCIAARCSLIHGQYPLHTGCYENTRMPEDRQSFMDALATAGYRTHGIGKCHFSPDRHALRGFQSRERQEEGGMPPDQDEYAAFLHEHGKKAVPEAHGVRGEMYYVPQLSQLPPELHPTQWIGDRSRTFIQEQKKSDSPWFLFSSFIHPHPPFAPPSPWHKLYRAACMPLPNVPPDSAALQLYVNRAQNRYKYRDQGLDTNLLRCMKAYYYACISFIDFQIGRILDALEQTGQLDNTLILFTGDHGEHLGDRNCFGKRSMHDSCARIPMLARLPGRFAAGQTCPTPTNLVDIAPTLLAAAGAEITSHTLDGEDLAALAAGQIERDEVFAQLAYPEDSSPEIRARYSMYMMVTSRWKYVYSAPDNQTFLFDREQDPLETRNRAGVVFYRQSVEILRQRLMAHLREGGETAGIDGDTWRTFPPPAMPRDPDEGLLIQDPAYDFRIPGYTREERL